MIIWLASYPKSGNTWLRFFILSLFFGDKGEIDLGHIKNIEQFPSKSQFTNLGINLKDLREISKNWINVQKKINLSKKIRFYKTHNTLCRIDNNFFTDQNNTLGTIYIVRDPRNIITSLTHHYSFNYSDALYYMRDEKSVLMDKSHENDHSNFTYLSSWSKHYRSWIENNDFKILFIKYEDLEKNKIDVFTKIINFINELMNDDSPINEKKLLNCIKSTNFNNLKNKELNEGFAESVYSKTTGKRINFFNLGKLPSLYIS